MVTKKDEVKEEVPQEPVTTAAAEPVAEPTPEPTGESVPEQAVEEPAPASPETEVPAEAPEAGNDIDAMIAELMPGADVSTPEAREATIGELLTRLYNINNSLAEVVDDEPEFGMVLNDILKGSKVATAFARHYGPDSFSEPVEGDPDFEEFGKYKQERAERHKKKQERQKSLKANEEVSMQEITSYMEEKGLTPEQAQDFFTQADEFFTDIFDGKITKDHLAMLEKAFGYEDAVAEAEETGKVAGRNEKIVEEKVKKPTTSGMPEINEGGMPPQPKERRTGLLDELYSKG